jgi:hypothetical protein
MTRYFLDPKKRRGELLPGEFFWEGLIYSGCGQAHQLIHCNHRFCDYLIHPWSAANQNQPTALLPWEV